METCTRCFAARPNAVVTHLLHILACTRWGKAWYSLRELQKRLAGYGIYVETQTISARLRDLRKNEYGGFHIERKPDPDDDAPGNKKIRLYALRVTEWNEATALLNNLYEQHRVNA